MINVIPASRWSASGSFANVEVEAVLADPAGWIELSGAAWSSEG